MASTTNAISNGPIAFIDGSGSHRVVPLSAVTFVDGVLTVEPAWSGAADWLRYLAAQGAIRAGASAPVPPAIKWQAVGAGVAGNCTTLTIKYTSPTAYELSVKREEIWQGLTPATVGTELSAHDSLVRVLDASPQLPKPLTATPLAGGGAAAASSLPVPGTSGTAFTLSARANGTDGDTIRVAIEDVADGRFTLTLEWTKTVTGVTLGSAGEAELAKLGFVVKALPPATGASIGLPAPGHYRLSGGVDMATAGLLSSARS